MYCPSCGKEVPNHATFCLHCGTQMSSLNTEPKEVVAAQVTKPSEVSEDTKQCPYCAETIKAEAVVCRYCGRDLVEKPKAAPKTTEKEAKKGTNWGCVIVFIIVAVFAVIWVLSQLGSSPSSRTRAPVVIPTRASSTYMVTYKVGGSTTRASVTYENDQGGTEQADIPVPWTKTFTFQSGDFVYISAQNDKDYGTITCEITVKGNVFKTAKSSGAYTIATCSGSVP